MLVAPPSGMSATLPFILTHRVNNVKMEDDRQPSAPGSATDFEAANQGNDTNDRGAKGFRPQIFGRLFFISVRNAMSPASRCVRTVILFFMLSACFVVILFGFGRMPD